MFRATETQRKEVKTLVGLGLRREEIATILEITPETLRKHFRNELDKGALEANAEVMRVLFKMATSGNNTAATIFWVRARCGWRERTAGDEFGLEGSEGEVPRLIVQVEE